MTIIGNGAAHADAACKLLGGAADLAQIRAVADCMPVLAWSCLPEGDCDYLSQRWVEFTGVPEEEHHGRGWLTAIHPEDRDRTGSGWDAFIAGEAPYDVDYRLRRVRRKVSLVQDARHAGARRRRSSRARGGRHDGDRRPEARGSAGSRDRRAGGVRPTGQRRRLLVLRPAVRRAPVGRTGEGALPLAAATPA